MFSRIKRIYNEYNELKYLAYHDSLTGLLNRNWLQKNIDKINVKYVYFIDINQLNVVNKKGHSFGDEHIKMVVNTINYRGILLRYAGDEFILFSNYKDEIKTNKLFSVGCSYVSKSISDSIKDSDFKMIKNKKQYYEKSST